MSSEQGEEKNLYIVFKTRHWLCVNLRPIPGYKSFSPVSFLWMSKKKEKTILEVYRLVL